MSTERVDLVVDVLLRLKTWQFYNVPVSIHARLKIGLNVIREMWSDTTDLLVYLTIRLELVLRLLWLPWEQLLLRSI